MLQGLRILVVDDSLFFREVVSRGINAYLPEGSIIEKASNPFEARDKILSFDPDVMVLDVEMPRMNGIEFLRRLVTQYDLPTIVLSSRPAYRSISMEAGAYGFMPKPATTDGISFMKELAANIKLAHEKHLLLINEAQKEERREQPIAVAKPVVEEENLSPLQKMLRSAKQSGYPGLNNRTGVPANQSVKGNDAQHPTRYNAKIRQTREDVGAMVSSMRKVAETSKKLEELSGRKKVSAVVPDTAPVPRKPVTLIAMGASTGGTEALSKVLRELQPPLPPIVIVQHIPPMFSKLFAERLENECAIHVKEAANGDQLMPGWAYVAPGDKQMTVKYVGKTMIVECFAGKKVNGHMPSVDVLFDSVAQNIGDVAMGVILTGMGEDGARGLLKMRQKGSVTLGQDEASSVVYGMPKAAYDMGAVTQQLPLKAIAGMMTAVARYQGR